MTQQVKMLAMQGWQPVFHPWNPGKVGQKESTDTTQLWSDLWPVHHTDVSSSSSIKGEALVHSCLYTGLAWHVQSCLLLGFFSQIGS